MERTLIASPRRFARVTGLFYALMMVIGGLGGFARNGLIMKGDAVATATQIVAHQSMWRLGFTFDVLMVLSYVVAVAMLYRLFRPVSRNLTVVAVCLGIMGCTIQSLAYVFEYCPLLVLGGASYLSVFTASQLQALAYLFIRLYSQTYGAALVFFACYCLLNGYLILKSTFLPRFVGVLLMVAGGGWLIFLWPSLGARLLNPYLMVTGVGEGVLVLWLLVFGVDPQRWNEQARAAGDLPDAPDAS